ncbi:hypothetical protein Y032_0613g675 [Ancylostoma ceylanicum]|uniref:Uncharacterized protein n=1 Tax=Ancylostoma ceylanicum TaxID=53326 RepID=A0A016WMZ5_9BILA|nr:hypothetical protein Y032_0613g675 [Ancylostoma ceylanicum]
MPPGLLVPSDDSDVDDSERRPPRRRFFQKSERGSRRWLVDAGVCHCLLLVVLSISIIFIAASTYSLTRRYAELSESLSALSQLSDRTHALGLHLHRLRMEFDLWRENSPNYANQTTDTTEYVYDVLERLTMELKEMKKKVDVASSVTEDVTRRLSTVETRCLNVCRMPMVREREKPRRRQAAKIATSADDEIVFRRS